MAEKNSLYEALQDRQREDALRRRRILTEELRWKLSEPMRSRVDARGIRHLVHFTPIENVESILRIGLRSRNALAGVPFICTDEQRFDGGLDWISFSVSFPNCGMFWKKRVFVKKNVAGWAVLLIRKEALWELDCRFVPTNASCVGVREFQGDGYSSVKAFERMFTEAERSKCIPDSFTTDPQAEVMIRNEVPKKYIDKIAVQCDSDKQLIRNCKNVIVEPISELFKMRSDYDSWRWRSLKQPSNQNGFDVPCFSF